MSPLAPGGNGDDPVPGSISGGVDNQFRSAQASRVGHDRPGAGVEGGDVRSPPRQHRGVPTGLDVGGPGGHGGVEGCVAGGCGDDPSLLGVPVDGGLDAPGSQLSERDPFVGVDLADVLSQDVDPVAVASHQRFQAAARADRAELAVIADHHHLRPGGPRRGQQAQHRRVIREAGLVGHDDAAGVQGELAVIQAPQQRRCCAGLDDLGFGAEGAGRLARDGGADHPVAGGLEGVTDDVDGGGLAGAGHTQHQVDTPARGAHTGDHRRLAGGERPATERLLLGGDRRLDRGGGHGREVAALGPGGDLDGDGGLDSEHARRGVGGLPGAGNADQRHSIRMSADGVDSAPQLPRMCAEDEGGDGDNHVGACEDLPFRQPPAGPRL